MKTKYWNALIFNRHALSQMEAFESRDRRISAVVSCFCTLASLACVAAWAIWKILPGLWAFLVGMAQIVQIIWPTTTASKRLACSKYLLPAMRTLLNNMENDWHKHRHSEEVMRDLLVCYNDRYIQLINTYTSDIDYPLNDRMANRVETESANYFRSRFGIEIWKEDLDAEQQNE